MSESSMREALLTQASDPASGPGLKMLHDVVESENRRARRLAKWTIGVWIAWPLAILLAVLLYALVSRASFQAAPAAPAPPQSTFVDMFLVVVSVIGAGSFLAALVLPVIGIILLVFTVLARRSATLTQVRTSLALIELQLKQLNAAQHDLGAAQKHSPSGPPATAG